MVVEYPQLASRLRERSKHLTVLPVPVCQVVWSMARPKFCLVLEQQPFLLGCFSWMTPNHYIQLKNCCSEFQMLVSHMLCVCLFDMVNGQMCNQESYLSSFTPWFFWLDALVWLPCLWSRSFMPTVTQQWRLAKCILHWITSTVEFQTLALSLTCSSQNHVGSHYD